MRYLHVAAIGAMVLVPGAWALGSLDARQADAGQGAMKAQATAELKDRAGKPVGRAELSGTPNGVIVRVNLENAPAGEHAFHIHAVGKCEPPFESAGGHFNPTNAKHGFRDAKGPHAGDLPNIHVPESGKLMFEFVADGVRLQPGAKTTLLDADGSALVMHANADDYQTDPAGAAGDRVACGVIQK